MKEVDLNENNKSIKNYNHNRSYCNINKYTNICTISCTKLIDAKVIYADNQIIEAEYNNKTYIVERDPDTSNEQWNKGETIILDLGAEDTHEALNGLYNGTIVQTYPDKNNLIVVNIDGNLYSFYADNSSYKVNDVLELNFCNDEIINADLL
jgi:hypothetical protein